MFKTTICVIVLAAIFAFAGVQPLAGYKDSVVNWFAEIDITSSSVANDQTEYAEVKPTQNDNNHVIMPNTKNVDNDIYDSNRLSLIEREVVSLVNDMRANRDSPTLVWDNELYSYSKSHSEEMAKRRQLFHTPEGMPYAENCWGGEGTTHWDAAAIVDGWMTSDFHRTWLLCPNVKHVAVGIATSDNGMYASWTFWVGETNYYTDWWYCNGSGKPPKWWY